MRPSYPHAQARPYVVAYPVRPHARRILRGQGWPVPVLHRDTPIRPCRACGDGLAIGTAGPVIDARGLLLLCPFCGEDRARRERQR